MVANNEAFINHFAFVVDRSFSMDGLRSEAAKVIDVQIENLAESSKAHDQETRATVYFFNDTTECLYYDKDVLRLPKVGSKYVPAGNTALIDATLKAIDDLKQTATLYGNHAFLLYVLTDGQENRSMARPSKLSSAISGLPDNWTIGVFVPNHQGVFEAKKFGFDERCIEIWDTTKVGLENVGQKMTKAADAYMTMRSKGITGTKNLSSLYTLDTSKLNRTSLTPLPYHSYQIVRVHEEVTIKDFVERILGKTYKVGGTYYAPTKKVVLQDYKDILVEDRSGNVFTSHNIRELLGLPPDTIDIEPGIYSDWRVYVQSTSVNRRLYPDQYVLVRE